MSIQKIVKTCILLLTYFIVSPHLTAQNDLHYSIDLGLGINRSDVQKSSFNVISADPALGVSVNFAMNLEKEHFEVGLMANKIIAVAGTDQPRGRIGPDRMGSISLFDPVIASDTWFDLRLLWKPRIFKKTFLVGGGYGYFNRNSVSRYQFLADNLTTPREVLSDAKSFTAPHVLVGLRSSNLKTLVRYNLKVNENRLSTVSIVNQYSFSLKKKDQIQEEPFVTKKQWKLSLHFGLGLAVSPNSDIAGAHFANIGLRYYVRKNMILEFQVDDYFKTFGVDEPIELEEQNNEVRPPTVRSIRRMESFGLITYFLNSDDGLMIGAGAAYIQRFDTTTGGLLASLRYDHLLFSNQIKLTLPVNKFPPVISFSLGLNIAVLFEKPDKSAPRRRF